VTAEAKHYDKDGSLTLSEEEVVSAVKDMGFRGSVRDLVHVVFNTKALMDPEGDREILWFDLTAVDALSPPVVDGDLQPLRAAAKNVILGFDLDGDGYLNQKESIGSIAVLLREDLALANAQILQPVWSAIDADGDGGITADELTEALHQANAALTSAADHVQTNLQLAFQGTDSNKDGEIQPEEVEVVAGRLMFAAGATAEEVAQLKVHPGEFASADVDGSGGISWDELPKEVTDGTMMRKAADQATSFVSKDVGPALQDILSLLDADGDGHVTQVEVGVGLFHGVSLA